MQIRFCPFCGHTDKLRHHERTTSITCEHCFERFRMCLAQGGAYKCIFQVEEIDVFDDDELAKGNLVPLSKKGGAF